MNTTNTTPMCLHCGRPIRGDARAYAGNGGIFHWECTEPAPALRIASLKLTPGDSVAVLMECLVSMEQRHHIEDYVADRLGVESVVVLDGGAGLSVLAGN